jgi:hypothetical protein
MTQEIELDTSIEFDSLCAEINEDESYSIIVHKGVQINDASGQQEVVYWAELKKTFQN